MPSKDPIGDRMKTNYERVTQHHLIRRMPVIVRVDGRAFHTFTKNCKRPYDSDLMKCMNALAEFLVQGVQNAKLAYCQSDEVSLLLTDYDEIATEQFFAGGVQKIASVTASMATCAFNTYAHFRQISELSHWEKLPFGHFAAQFDSRCFNVPENDVVNYFVWRQRDAERNSIQMYAQSCFPQSRLQGLNCSQLQELLWSEAAVNWNDADTWTKRGWCVYRDTSGNVLTDFEIPVFSQDRNYVERFLPGVDKCN